MSLLLRMARQQPSLSVPAAVAAVAETHTRLAALALQVPGLAPVPGLVPFVDHAMFHGHHCVLGAPPCAVATPKPCQDQATPALVLPQLMTRVALPTVRTSKGVARPAPAPLRAVTGLSLVVGRQSRVVVANKATVRASEQPRSRLRHNQCPPRSHRNQGHALLRRSRRHQRCIRARARLPLQGLQPRCAHCW